MLNFGGLSGNTAFTQLESAWLFKEGQNLKLFLRRPYKMIYHLSLFKSMALTTPILSSTPLLLKRW
jgi:hypothetical protein